MAGLDLGIEITLGSSSGEVADTTPGGALSALLLEDGSSGLLLEDGGSDLLLEG